MSRLAPAPRRSPHSGPQRTGPSSEDCGMTSDVITNTECDTHTRARARATHVHAHAHAHVHAKIRMCKKRHDENRTSSRESANGVLFSFSMFPLQLAAVWSPILQQMHQRTKASVLAQETCRHGMLGECCSLTARWCMSNPMPIDVGLEGRLSYAFGKFLRGGKVEDGAKTEVGEDSPTPICFSF